MAIYIVTVFYGKYNVDFNVEFQQFSSPQEGDTPSLTLLHGCYAPSLMDTPFHVNPGYADVLHNFINNQM